MPSYSKVIELPGKSAQEIYSKISEGIERFLTKIPVGEHQVHREPQNFTVKLESKMANLNLVCVEGGVSMSGSLSFMALPFKSKLDEGIGRWIQKTFG